VKLGRFFTATNGVGVDPSMKIYFDDLTLAYNTLYNDASRQEYDEYLDQYYAMSGHHRRHRGEDFDEDDPEIK